MPRLQPLAMVTALASMMPAASGCEESAPKPTEPPVAPEPAYLDPTLPGIARPSTETDADLRRRAASKRSAYQERTQHRDDAGKPTYVNRLIRETSPYLLQHAHNPVNWYPWGDEAFERAKAEAKPVFLSVGYSTCHWCHVMEHESFEDLEIAKFLNENFICIKVDREERPDLDAIYMRAVTVLTGAGGWPMTVFLTPEKKPFFAGTYFPARDGDRPGQVGFRSVLTEVITRYRQEPDEVERHAAELTQHVQSSIARASSGDLGEPGRLLHARDRIAARYDSEHGGFSLAPKFPTPSRLSFLLRVHRRANDAEALSMVTKTLDSMAAGGIHDPIGGGFHRYATDRAWRIPHFEKMLYDNAQLAALYVEAYQATGDARYAKVATDTLTYVLREMTSDRGAFFSATDADSLAPGGERIEGYFFTFTAAEVDELAGEDKAFARDAFGITDEGNLEGRNVLHRAASISELAAKHRLLADEVETKLERIGRILFEARERRPRPHLDDKIIASHNGLMASAFARAGIALGREDFVKAALRALDVVRTELLVDGRLRRTFRAGVAQHPAILDDYAFVIAAMLDAFEASADVAWLERAKALQATQDELYADPEGGYFLTASTTPVVIAREKPRFDNAEPSGNAISALNLLRLYELTGDAAYQKRAIALFESFATTMGTSAPSMTMMLSALDFHFDDARQVVLVAPSGESPRQSPLAQAVQRTFLPNRVLVWASDPAAPELLKAIPLVEGKAARDGRPTAYVCTEGRCELPTTQPDELRKQLAQRVALVGSTQPERPPPQSEPAP